MAIVMMAFFVSCGEVPEPENSNSIGGTINLLESEPITEKEEVIIKNTCKLLKLKEREMKAFALYYPDNKFKFKAKRINCLKQETLFNYSVTLSDNGQNIFFKPQGNTTFGGFSDILFDGNEALVEFCKLASAGTLSEREVVDGDELVSILATKAGSETVLKLAFASRLRGDDFKVHSKAGFVILDKFKNISGLVINRVDSSNIGCSTGENFLYSELLEINL
jgi:hypothetical protein